MKIRNLLITLAIMLIVPQAHAATGSALDGSGSLVFAHSSCEEWTGSGSTVCAKTDYSMEIPFVAFSILALMFGVFAAIVVCGLTWVFVYCLMWLFFWLSKVILSRTRAIRK